MLRLPPILGYLSFNAQADDTMDFSLDDAYTFEDTFSWFIPDKAGRHDTKFGARYTDVWISNPNNSKATPMYCCGFQIPPVRNPKAS